VRLDGRETARDLHVLRSTVAEIATIQFAVATRFARSIIRTQFNWDTSQRRQQKSLVSRDLPRTSRKDAGEEKKRNQDEFAAGLLICGLQAINIASAQRDEK
jgi:hypothetical protein